MPVTTPTAQTAPASRPDRLRPFAAPAVAGAIAAGVAIAISELIAGFVAGAPSLVTAIGQLVIDLQPPGAKDFMVGLFGTNDKLALTVFIVVVALAIAGAIGVAGSRNIHRADIGFGVFGLVGLFAASRLALVSLPLAVVTTIVALAGGSGPCGWSLAPLRSGRARRGRPRQGRPSRRRHAGHADLGSSAVPARQCHGRRCRARRGRDRSIPPPEPCRGRTPGGRRPASRHDRGAAHHRRQSLNVPGITPIVVPNDQFYRIDTALIPPRVDAATWKLTIKGMVDRVVTLDYKQLSTMPLFEQYVTIQCVSNEVGGDLVGNTVWTGVHLRDVLAMAGVQAGATQIVGRSVDGFTAGFPTEWAMDTSRDPMIVLQMNGQPLPIEHGYPARLIVPGLYGYVSATKWLTEIELTTLEAFDGYWVPLGWSKLGPILTQSRIDVPRAGSSIKAGATTIAGVAWAPDRGVSKVEVSVDSGAWQLCTLSQAISKATWVQWELPWTAAGRPPPHRSPRHGRHRRRPDRPAVRSGAGRRPRPPHDLRAGVLSRGRSGPPSGRGRHQERSRSTPVMTMPRTNTRWKATKMSTGTMSVMIVPAWMSPGSWAMRAPLKFARPTATVWRSACSTGR